MTTDAGTNWTLVEDVALCTSWVEVTHDSLTGNEMQLREMWSLIHTKYVEKIGGQRTKESMSSRWKLLSQSFSLWRDALAQSSSNLRSGESLADQELQAQAWYSAKTKNKNKSFNRWECWNIVKSSPKFKVVPIGPEVVFNSTPTHLHSMSGHSSHDHDEDDAEEVPETPRAEQASGSTRFPIRPQGKKASKRKGNASKTEYAKYMEDLARQGELTLAREIAKFEADKAIEDAKAAAFERKFQADERERELLRQEREHTRQERMAQRDREIMKEPLQGKSPNSKYFWRSEKEDVIRRRRAREARASGDGPSTTREDYSSTTREDDPSTTNWLGDDYPFTNP